MVGATADKFEDDVANVVNDVRVVPVAANHSVASEPAIDPIVAVAGRDLVVEIVSFNLDRACADEDGLLDILIHPDTIILVRGVPSYETVSMPSFAASMICV